VTIDFSSASNVILSSVQLIAFDIDTPTGGFAEVVTVTDGNGATALNSAGAPLAGNQSHTLALNITGPVTLTPNLNPGDSSGLSGFDLSFDVIPEPATGLLALLGCSFLIVRRRR